MHGVRVVEAVLPSAGARLTVRGTLDLTSAFAIPFAAAQTGLQLRLGPVDGAPLVSAIAASARCTPADGWSGLAYRNTADRIPPTCTVGSGGGLRTLRLTDRRSRGRGVGFAAQLVVGPEPFPDVVSVQLTTADTDHATVSSPCAAARLVCRHVGRRTTCKAATS